MRSRTLAEYLVVLRLAALALAVSQMGLLAQDVPDSAPAWVLGIPPATIVTQPISQAVKLGDTATFSINVTGPVAAYSVVLQRHTASWTERADPSRP